MNALSSETAALWDGLYAIVEPMRWSGNCPDPAALATLPPLIADYETFVRPRRTEFFGVSRHEVDRRTVRSAHDDFLLRAREARDMLTLCPKDVDPLIARTRAAGRLLYLWNVKKALEHEAELVGVDVPIPRLCCDARDRSIWLEGKLLASAVEESVFEFFRLLNARYPNPITFAEMRTQSVHLEVANQSRFKRSLPNNLAKLFESVRGKGNKLKLPKPRG